MSKGRLEQLLEFARSTDASSEEDSKRDGFLSYSAETHAAMNGFYKGATGMRPNPTEPDSEREVHYFRGFFVAGRAASLLGGVAAGGAFF